LHCCYVLCQFACDNKALITICLALYCINCHSIISIAVPETEAEI